jgi:hypothetical protein
MDIVRAFTENDMEMFITIKSSPMLSQITAVMVSSIGS